MWSTVMIIVMFKELIHCFQKLVSGELHMGIEAVTWCLVYFISSGGHK